MSLCVSAQAAELAEFTAKIALLEEAKRKKDEEASEWQHKVRLVIIIQLENCDLIQDKPNKLTKILVTSSSPYCVFWSVLFELLRIL